MWELPQDGPVNSWGGVLSTAGGVVFFGADNGTFMAADSKTGAPALDVPVEGTVEVVTDVLHVRQRAARR